MSDNISFKLDNLERSVNSCSTQAIEDAVNVGEHLSKMGSEDLARLRASISRYKEDCYSVRIPLSARERAGEKIAEVKRAMEIGAVPATKAIEKIKTGAISKIESAKKTLMATVREAEKEIERESERRGAIARAKERMKSRTS